MKLMISLILGVYLMRKHGIVEMIFVSLCIFLILRALFW